MNDNDSSNTEQDAGSPQCPRQTGIAETPTSSEPCNTLDAICTIYRFGIATLHLSFQGQVTSEGFIQLSKARECARSDNEAEQALALVSILDHQFCVAPSGGRLFKYMLSDHAYRIQLHGEGAKRLPMAFCQIRSNFLLAVGVEQAVSQLKLVLSALGVLEGEPKVARIDLCADFSTSVDLGAVADRAWVGRAKHRDKHWVGDLFTGWSIGRGDLVLRVYNKIAEAEKSGKTYLFPLYREKGWDGEAPVYRQEIQLRGKALHELSAKDYPGVLEKLGGLWSYFHAQWLRLAVPNDQDQTPTRWPVHPLWSALRDEVPWGEGLPLERVAVRLNRAPADFRLYQGLMSSLTSYMAAKNIDDPLLAMQQMYDETKAYYDDYSDLRDGDFVVQAMGKAGTKALRYGVPFSDNQPVAKHRRDKAVADEYRRKSGR